MNGIYQGLLHAWTKCGIWESYSREILLLEGNICNFEGFIFIEFIFDAYL